MSLPDGTKLPLERHGDLFSLPTTTTSGPLPILGMYEWDT
jgi:hypothetical protein